MRRQLRLDSAPPRDFHRFWRNTLDELESVPVDLTREPSRSKRSADPILENISFASLGGVRLARLVDGGVQGESVFGDPALPAQALEVG